MLRVMVFILVGGSNLAGVGSSNLMNSIRAYMAI